MRLQSVLFCLSLFCSTRALAQEPRPYTRAWPVMGTMLGITAWDTDSVRAQRGLSAARAAVFRVDTLMSIYKPDSEVSAINRRAGTDSATIVSPETAEVLSAALRYAEQTRGALDVTVGPLVDVWGFYRHRGTLPPRAARDSAARLVGWKRVRFDPHTRSVALPVHGMRLDFGAIAKGYALDRGAAALRAQGVTSGSVDLGGNSLYVGRPPQGSLWGVGIQNPRKEDDLLALATFESGAIATSGNYEQFFERDGVRYSHIFNPRTGKPSRGIASATVLAQSGMASDALSTALFVLGPEAGCALAARLGVGALWVRELNQGGNDGSPAIVMTPGLESRIQFQTERSRGAKTVYTLCGRHARTPKKQGSPRVFHAPKLLFGQRRPG